MSRFLRVLLAVAAAAQWSAAAEPSASPRYGSARALLADYESAMRVAVSTHDISFSLAKYFACVSFQKDSDAVCGGIDKHMAGRERMSWTCMKYRLGGLRFREFVRGGDSIEYCLRDDKDILEAQGESWDSEESAQACREQAPFYRVPGGLEGYCARALRHSGAGPDDEHEVPDMDECRKRFAYLGDRIEGCAVHENGIMRENCVEEFKLLKALRENKPEAAAHTVFAPLVDRGASCDGLERRALAKYEKYRAEYAAILRGARRAHEREKGR